eukprot:Nk52_evm14s2284 gene=Nk52_evmTU14s2284
MLPSLQNLATRASNALPRIGGNNDLDDFSDDRSVKSDVSVVSRGDSIHSHLSDSRKQDDKDKVVEIEQGAAAEGLVRRRSITNRSRGRSCESFHSEFAKPSFPEDDENNPEPLPAKQENNVFALLDFVELPHFLKDNDYIHSSYRGQLSSFTNCAKSLLYIHNETVNIYSHLFGFLIFFFLTIFSFCAGYVALDDLSKLPWKDQLVFCAFFLGAMLCLMFSTLFHTCFVHSPRVFAVFSRLDYAGIAFLISGSCYPIFYYAFACMTMWRDIWLGAITVFGTACIIVSCFPKFDKPQYRTTRMFLFLSMGLSSVVPGIQYIAMRGWALAVDAFALYYMLAMGALYITGAVMYACRFPECYFPGKCDILFHSHQFFHLLVVAAAIVHYFGIHRALEYRNQHGCTEE